MTITRFGSDGYVPLGNSKSVIPPVFIRQIAIVQVQKQFRRGQRESDSIWALNFDNSIGIGGSRSPSAALFSVSLKVYMLTFFPY
jgi:hypothetical protein